MRQGEAVFVDSGAWIALALSRDPLHPRAREQWDLLRGAGAKLHSSVPVVIETFTFLDRNANRDVALTWKEAIYKPGTVRILPSDKRDLEHSWDDFRRANRRMHATGNHFILSSLQWRIITAEMIADGLAVDDRSKRAAEVAHIITSVALLDHEVVAR